METSCLCRIRLIYKALGTFEASLERQFGINFNEAMLLCLLSGRCAEAGPVEGAGCCGLKAGEIAEELGLSNSNASKVISAAERSGLIRRRACKEDARCMKFTLTQKGRETLGRLSCDELRLPDGLARLVGDLG